MKNYLDFDAFLREHEAEPILVRVFGKTYPVRPEIPAIVPILMARGEGTEDPQEATRLVLRAADALFGKEALEEIAEGGLGVDALAALIAQLFDRIRGAGDGAQEVLEGERRRAAAGG